MIWHQSIRSWPGNGTMGKTRDPHRRPSCTRPGRKCGGDAGKGTPGKRRSMNGPQGAAALSARACWTGTRSSRGNPTLRHTAPGWPGNGTAREIWGLHRSRSGRFQQGKSGGSVKKATTGSAQSRSARKGQAARFAMGGFTGSRG